MQANGGLVIHRDRRTRRLAVVVAVQNVLVTVSLGVALYLLWDVQSRKLRTEQASEDSVHIRFHPIPDVSGNVTLQLGEVFSNNKMSVVGENRQIYVNCTGPYVLYMYLCYMDMDEKEANGTLQLQVVGRRTPVSSFNLSASQEVCSGLNSVAFLKEKEKVSLHLYATDGFKIKTMTVGLRYLLGSRCEY